MARLDEVRRRVAQADAVCVLTGAGMSAESGIPTFRDALSPTPGRPKADSDPLGGSPRYSAAGSQHPVGLWARFDPMRLACADGFRADPQLVWDWYAERREGVRRAQPNAGHEALAAFERAHPGRLTVVTQNVDDLHQRAGSTGVIRLHGDILQDCWLRDCSADPACEPAKAAPGRPPRCERCGNLVRPGVVWFGESLPADAFAAAEQAAERCALMLVVGTSGAVYPAAGLAATARAAGAHVVIVNPQPSELDGAAHTVLRGTAATVLPPLLGG